MSKRLTDDQVQAIQRDVINAQRLLLEACQPKELPTSNETRLQHFIDQMVQHLDEIHIAKFKEAKILGKR